MFFFNNIYKHSIIVFQQHKKADFEKSIRLLMKTDPFYLYVSEIFEKCANCFLVVREFL
ncbi:unnamed protein product [Amoebophrya sp. A120]|nr:unnamed protein product [Amoebophrya sp. A120]|eukprot:GSA120T00010143001.1